MEGKQYVDLWMSESEINAIVEPETKAKYVAEYAKFFTSVIMPGEPTDSP